MYYIYIYIYIYIYMIYVYIIYNKKNSGCVSRLKFINQSLSFLADW